MLIHHESRASGYGFLQAVAERTLDALDIWTRQSHFAAHMQVNIRTVQDWVNAGELARVMIGKREYRIRRSELMRFIKERERKG